METPEDIIREMRELADRGANLSSPRHTQEAYIYIGRLADRIAAAKRRGDEISLLRAALAPVLAIPTDSLTGLWGVPLPDGGMMLTPEGVASAMKFIEAVRECKRIYGEGDEG